MAMKHLLFGLLALGLLGAVTASGAHAQTTNTSVTCTNQNTTDKCIEFTSLPTTSNTLHFNCTGIAPQSNTDNLVGEVQTGGNSWKSDANYTSTTVYSGSASPYNTSGGDGVTNATDVFNTHLGAINSSYGTSVKADLDLPGSSAYKTILWTIGSVDPTPTAWQIDGLSYYHNSTAALTGFRLRNTTASHTLGGQCTMTVWQ